ncbi:DUF1810 domain-containing protein [Novosphingobium aquimarinum]|uniref:DUF1810 domain-containing protein n=1 Tax=Novosphingobium aquimarinum TaxID=2682494 RepID=UPI0012EC1CEE|nr:DUF1810 domain-containing protein [Novosphingobium aquimarinum]
MLGRFVTAQEDAFEQALGELREGQKQTHWIWFIFPQIAGLGHSTMARHYAISDRREAQDYLAHPILAPRLREATNALSSWQGRRGAEEILGSIDALKVRSSMTLFEAVSDDPLFGLVLDGFYDGSRDDRTLSLLRGDL